MWHKDIASEREEGRRQDSVAAPAMLSPGTGLGDMRADTEVFAGRRSQSWC